MFDANSFMIAASSNVSFDVERGADGLKDTVLESAVIVNDNQTAGEVLFVNRSSNPLEATREYG